jgi:hypothetical protein
VLILSWTHSQADTILTHLFRYLDERAFRYNTRKDANDEVLSDGERFSMAVSQIVGKRLMYAELTGKVQETSVN